MAQRRMFSKTVIQSTKFMNLSDKSQALYIQMGVSADDDGVVDAYLPLAMSKATNENLAELMNSGFIYPLSEENVFYIVHWLKNNDVRIDRGKHGEFIEELRKLNLPTKEFKEDSNDNQMSTKCQPSDNQVTPQDRIGKDSLDKISLDKISKEENSIEESSLGKNNRGMGEEGEPLGEDEEDWENYSMGNSAKQKPKKYYMAPKPVQMEDEDLEL